MRGWLTLFLMLAASPAAAQSVVTSTAPDAVAVSVFRDPERSEGGEIERDWLNGFALISETRTIDLAAGESVIRFEGVAEGMIAVSAIVTGLPGGVVQKNRDAALLSPASLLDGSLGNRVHIRRTDRATGRVSEDEAIIRSGPQGAVVLQTAAGFESLRCTGLPESIIYNGIPAGLTAKPTLSVTTRSLAAQRVTVTLTYLSTGFDWASNYVARVAADGRAIAGTLNTVSDFDSLADVPQAPPLRLTCFPLGTGRYGIPSPPPPPAPAAYLDNEGDNIVVTAQRRSAPMMESAMAVSVVAELENLGDLKLYRVPIPVTVAANGQKQVALLVKDGVPFKTIYRLRSSPGDTFESMEVERVLRMENKEAARLGVPLPSGQVAVFAPRGDESLLVGEGQVRDHAVGEKVDLVIGESSQVRVDIIEGVAPKMADGDYRVTVTNANPFAVDFELGFYVDSDPKLDKRLRKLPRRDGLLTWAIRVPANDSRSFDYRFVEPD